jgi:hypothetical protein
VNRSRERLFEAAREFADRIYELARADLLDEVRRNLGIGKSPPPAPAPAPTPREPAARAPRGEQRRAADTSELVIAFVSGHPGCRRGELAKAVDASPGALDAALRSARERAAIRMEGTRAKARYFPAQGTTQLEPEPEPERKHQRARRPEQAHGRERAEELLEELEQSLAGDMHPTRLASMLQAIVAEIRQLKPSIPQHEPVAALLDRAMRRITAVRQEQALGFITGLKRDADADWETLARHARASVAAFDRGAAEAPPENGA